MSVFLGRAFSRHVHMALYDVAVKTSVHQHGALHVNFVAYFQQPEVGTFKCLSHGCHGIGIVLDADHREAYTVVGYALVNAKFVHKRTGEGKVNIILVVNNVDDRGKFFDDSGKHNRIISCD